MICHKIPYVELAQAHYIRKRTLRLGQLDPHLPLDVYRCKACHSWHLGHKPFRDLKTEPYARPRSNWRTWEIDE